MRCGRGNTSCNRDPTKLPLLRARGAADPVRWRNLTAAPRARCGWDGEAAAALVRSRAHQSIGNRPLHSPFSEPYDFLSPHEGICHFLFADGSVHALSIDIEPHILQALATRDAEDTANGWKK